MIIKGTFEVEAQAEPPHDVVGGVALSRASFAKRFHGELTATSTVSMLAVHTPVEGSASYVAVERIMGAVSGRHGSFVVLHRAFMNRGAPQLSVTIAPDSGTDSLTGIRGTMDIHIVDGKHFYELDYEL